MIFFTLVALSYIIIIFLLPIIWRIMNSKYEPTDNKIDNLTIVVPFRNEENNLSHLLKSINNIKTSLNLNYVFVNDHSEDNGPEIIKKWIKEKEESAILINLPIEYKGKKEALNYAIQNVQSQWIWQIDADITFDENVLDLFEYSADHSNEMYLAPVLIKENKQAFKNHFQIFENLILQFITSFFAKINLPFLANGANIYYKKEVFMAYQNSGIGKEYPGGDDMFLLSFVNKNYGNNSIKILNHSRSKVFTNCVNTSDEFWNQKIRWASKMNNKILKIPFSVKFISFYISLISILFILSFLFIPINLVIAFFALKYVTEIFAFQIVSNFYNSSVSLFLYPFYLIVYPFYSFKVYLLSKKSNFEWKKRVYS